MGLRYGCIQGLQSVSPLPTAPLSSSCLMGGDAVCLCNSPGGRDLCSLVAAEDCLGFTWLDQPGHTPIFALNTGVKVVGVAHGHNYSHGTVVSVTKGAPSSWEKQPCARTQTWWAKFQSFMQTRPAQVYPSGPRYADCQAWMMFFTWSWVHGVHSTHST